MPWLKEREYDVLVRDVEYVWHHFAYCFNDRYKATYDKWESMFDEASESRCDPGEVAYSDDSSD